MKTKGYLTRALEDYKVVRGFLLSEGVTNIGDIDGLYRSIESSQKFNLPDNGVILGLSGDSAFDAILEFKNLPYPKTSLEFDYNFGEEERHPVVAYFQQAEAGAPIYCVLLYKYALWTPSQWSFEINVQGGSCCMRRLCGPVEPDPDDEQMEEDGARARYDHLIKVLGDLMSALSCKNVVERDVPAPRHMNMKREKKGKQPIFSYKVLVVDPGNTKSVRGGGKGTHASPRVHLRRGHIRRLPKGNIWVNAAVVGDKSKGMVVKDYAVRQTVH